MKKELIPIESRSRGTNGPEQELWMRLESFLTSRAPNTLTTYMGVLNEWCSFLGAKIGTPLAARRMLGASDLDAMAYLRWLQKQPGQRPRWSRGKKPPSASRALEERKGATFEKRVGLDELQTNATMNKKLSALRRMYRMLIAINLLRSSKNPFDVDVVRPPARGSGMKRPTEMVPFELVAKVIDVPDRSTPKGVQDRAILSCLFGGGLRRGEVIELRVGDVRRSQAGTVFLHLRATKSGKDADQALPGWAAAAVLAHHALRAKSGASQADYLFVSFRGKGGMAPTGRKMSPEGIRTLFRRSCEAAGVAAFVSPHSARATAITRLLAQGIPHREVKEFSRHASIQMVELYDKRRIGVDENPAVELDFDITDRRKR